MRENYRLMSSLAVETRLHPGKRIEKLMKFNKRLREVHAIEQELSEWNLQLDNKLLEVPARQLAVEKIFFGADVQTSADKGDWTKAMQNKKCVIAPRLSNWVFVITERDKNFAQVLLDFYYYKFVCARARACVCVLCIFLFVI